jgi:hypothetical protein
MSADLPPEGRLLRNSDLCQSLDKSLRQGEMGIGSTCDLIKAVIREKAWTRRKIRTGEIVECKSLRELITAPPLKGYGEKVEDVQRMISNDPEADAAFREAMVGSLDNVKGSDGNGKAYTLSRLKRETPDLFAAVVRGDMSANAAAIKAGWRKKKTPLDQLRAALANAAPAERRTHAQEFRDNYPEAFTTD